MSQEESLRRNQPVSSSTFSSLSCQKIILLLFKTVGTGGGERRVRRGEKEDGRLAVTFPTTEEEMAMPLDVICSRAKGSTRRGEYKGCLVLSTWTFPLVLQRSPVF